MNLNDRMPLCEWIAQRWIFHTQRFIFLRILLFLSLFSLLSTPSSPLGAAETEENTPLPSHILGKRVDSILVSVDGEVVTLSDVLLETARQERELAAVFTGERLFSETEKLRRATVEQIINRKLVYREYKRKPFPVPPQSVEAMIDGLVQDFALSSREALEKYAEKNGTSLAELKAKAKEKIAVDVMLSFFCDRQVNVTPKEVFEEYERNPDRWTRPETLTLQLLQISKDSKTIGNDPEVRAGELAMKIKGSNYDQFAGFAALYSDGPKADRGGDIGKIERAKLRPEFAQALKNAAPGDVAGPVKAGEAFYFLRLAALEPAKKIPFNNVSEKIHEELQAKAFSEARNKYFHSLRMKAVVRYYF